ncbi:hypothetical protein BCR33DRAFT_785320 [Rhizoclosmatium globosum]|uniref:Uncharacterized protein n=1 Tax=Rhizoclosmatium globosum TaxID=329046 RepID=A0A1Y2CB49_9FUNG|nr:hypothetical protein BCR33DRAFT_785320 [Rhizoclosmatium globosum]|eukprot:ORY44074.1 hypothetical protein BCR33DRAFT_785320 [Rhizoclosmatium globosum]
MPGNQLANPIKDHLEAFVSLIPLAKDNASIPKELEQQIQLINELKVAHEARLVELKAATKAAQVDINMNQGKLFQKSKNKPNNKEERKLVLQQAEILERETKIAQESVLLETQSRLDTLKLKASSFASTRAELTNIFSKILLLSPKPDEKYASNLLTRAVA